ncbi:uncharacterized protein LOC135386874 [Ornithodoros turicata]|uniref:uncharacterized protein LOC135386874 n=1 Tax=Ornithodoros turicata TaxID=34597 RepID=UPI00313A3B6E
MVLARMGRVATATLISCKNEIIANNVNSSIVKEAARICVGIRICYAVAEPFLKNVTAFKETVLTCIERMARVLQAMEPDRFAAYNMNITRVMQSTRRCGYNHIPMDVKYVLHGLRYLHSFVLG